jgi:hypothetical protein
LIPHFGGIFLLSNVLDCRFYWLIPHFGDTSEVLVVVVVVVVVVVAASSLRLIYLSRVICSKKKLN